jgi:hypothetical protein
MSSGSGTGTRVTGIQIPATTSAFQTQLAADVLAMLADFGESVSYTPQGGAAASITGIWDDAAEEWNPYDQHIDVTNPQLTTSTAAVPNAKAGDTINRNLIAYTVKSAKPDGTGVTILELVKA